MGGSSKQVIGYQYFSFFLLFIGNPIEKVLGINFDKRGWHAPLIDEMGNPLNVGVIEKATLYGENEGGVAGQIHARYGTDNQEVVSFYKEYMESKELPASAYPYQSYLAFPDFYVGNSGYMKEMLLWPNRVHVRNDGREQWYDEKSEIQEIYHFSVSDKYRPLSTPMKTKCYWAGTDWFFNPVVGNADVGYFTFPMSEKQISYQVKFLGAGELADGEPMPQEPSIIAAADFISSKGMPSIEDGTALPPVRWKLNKLPDYDNYGQGQIVRQYSGEGIFYWSGGLFDYKAVTSANGASVGIYKDDTQIIGFGAWIQGQEWAYHEGQIEMQAGVYSVKFDVGDRHSGYSASRPLIHFIAKQNSVKIPGGDINPIHKIREILTDDTAMNKPESSVNDANFRKAADRVWNEGLGISWSITEKSCMDAINELCYHIEAGIRVNRQTGLYEMVLFRDNWFEESEIHTIPENKIKSTQYEITNADEVINQVNVNYYDRANIKNSSFSISENGLIQTLNRVNAETVDFPYFMNMRNAEIVANWKLKQLSTGAIKGAFTTGWREARKWNRYDLIRLPWSKRWTGTILVRIMSINLGGPANNEVSIEFIEVVPSTGMMNTTIIVDDPVDTKPAAPQPCNAKVFELPYFEAVQAFGEREVNTELTDNPEAGYLCAIAERPQNNSLNAALHVDSGNGFERAATVNYCETAYLDQAIDRISNTLVVKNVGNITSVRTGSQIFINDEIMVYQSYDAETKALTVKRGAFGIPQSHTSSSILYFADDFVAVDQTLYVQTEIVNAKVLTATPSGVLDLADAVNHEVEFNARAIRPYPPANVKINGGYWPVDIETDLILTWVDRNRLQQTGGEILGWFDGGVTIEPNTQTHLVLSQLDENNAELATINANITGATSYTMPISTMQADTRSVKIILKTIRDGYECLYPFVHTVELSQFFSAPYDLTVEFKND